MTLISFLSIKIIKCHEKVCFTTTQKLSKAFVTSKYHIAAVTYILFSTRNEFADNYLQLKIIFISLIGMKNVMHTEVQIQVNNPLLPPSAFQSTRR